MAAKQFLERQRTQTETAQFIQLLVIYVKPLNISDVANLVTCCEFLFLSSSNLELPYRLHLSLKNEYYDLAEIVMIRISQNKQTNIILNFFFIEDTAVKCGVKLDTKQDSAVPRAVRLWIRIRDFGYLDCPDDVFLS